MLSTTTIRPLVHGDEIFVSVADAPHQKGWLSPQRLLWRAARR
jgi:hypothetical protein